MNIVARVVIPKKMAINFGFIARRSIMASGRLNAATAIIKAKAVPKGNPFWKSATATGRIAAQLPYMGTPISVAIGTDQGPPLPTTNSTASRGM